MPKIESVLIPAIDGLENELRMSRFATDDIIAQIQVLNTKLRYYEEKSESILRALHILRMQSNII